MTSSTPALAQSSGSAGTSADVWKFTAAPYLMVPRMAGTAAVRGRDHEVNSPARSSELEGGSFTSARRAAASARTFMLASSL